MLLFFGLDLAGGGVNILEQLLAEHEIRHLLARYAQCADDLDAEGVARLFAQNGALVLPDKRIEGRDAIGQWLRSTLQSGRARHLFMNPLISVASPAHAHGSSDMLALRGGVTGWTLAATLRYSDHYVKTDDGWKFSERQLRPMLP